MRAAPDDEFKLRFPVAKDRTLRRIAIIQIVFVWAIPITFFTTGIFFKLSRKWDPRWPENYGDPDPASPFFWAALISIVIFVSSIFLLIIMSILKNAVLTRRYGWRAMSDPIEAQRVAMREALYDVATGSTHPDVELEHNGDRIMVVPVRRLRPVGARLELTAERDRAQTSHEP